MIDAHCHLEQDDYSNDRDKIISDCKESLKALVTSCAHPKHFDITMNIVKQNPGFVFAATGLHPEYVKEITETEKKEYLSKIKDNRDNISAIGEVGLDYHWIQEEEWMQKQRELFREMIRFSQDLDLPLVIHCRKAFDDTLSILEDEGAKRVQLHMFGDHKSVDRVVSNGWLISCNAIVLKSKGYKKVAKKTPLDNLMLETDAPWLHPKSFEGQRIRNTPLTIKAVAEKIAEVKGVSFQEVWESASNNAIRHFSLGL